MGELGFKGTVRTQYINQIRTMHLFSVERPVTLVVKAIYTAPRDRLVWMECVQGTWRLPHSMWGWAEEVEDRAREIVGRDDILPCPIVFAPKDTEDDEDDEARHFEVELRPYGYKPFLLA